MITLLYIVSIVFNLGNAIYFLFNKEDKKDPERIHKQISAHAVV